MSAAIADADVAAKKLAATRALTKFMLISIGERSANAPDRAPKRRFKSARCRFYEG
jgi:hypothetical protein